MSEHQNELCRLAGVSCNSSDDMRRLSRREGGRIKRLGGGPASPQKPLFGKTSKGKRVGYVDPESMKNDMRENHDIGELVGKVKKGAEDAWGKVKGAFRFQEGGKSVPMKRCAKAPGGVGKIRKDQYK